MTNKTVEVTISEYMANKYKLEEGKVYKGTYLGIAYEGSLEDGLETALIVALHGVKTVVVYEVANIKFI